MSRRPRVLLDLTPLRTSPGYRALWASGLVSYLGRQMSVVAVMVQVYALTGSSLAVGLVSLAQAVPLLLGSWLGGVIADRFDRRVILLCLQLPLALTSVLLALNARHWDSLGILVVAVVLNAAFSAVDSPARTALIPSLVPRTQLTSAFALEQTYLQVGLIVGPAIAGFIAASSLELVYWIEAGCFVLSATGILLIRRTSVRRTGPHQPVGRAIGETFGFLGRSRLVMTNILLDVTAMVFGMPRALFPEMADTIFGGGAEAVGLLNAAPGVGAVVALLFSGWLAGVGRPGRTVAVAVVAWGIAILAFGLTPWLWLALCFLAVGGFADVISAIARGAILQRLTPDRFRGRVSAVQDAAVVVGPRIGDLRVSAMSTAFGPAASIVAGGVLCIAGTIGLVVWCRGYVTSALDRPEGDDDGSAQRAAP